MLELDDRGDCSSRWLQTPLSTEGLLEQAAPGPGKNVPPNRLSPISALKRGGPFQSFNCGWDREKPNSRLGRFECGARVDHS